MQPVPNHDGTVDIVPSEQWVSEKKVKRCQVDECRVEFGILKRRSRCNACGRVCCTGCVASKVALPPVHMAPVGVCMHCFLLIQSGPQGSARSAASPSRDDSNVAAEQSPYPAPPPAAAVPSPEGEVASHALDEPATESPAPDAEVSVKNESSLYDDAAASPEDAKHTDRRMAVEHTAAAAVDEVREQVTVLEAKAELLRGENEQLQEQYVAMQQRTEALEAELADREDALRRATAEAEESRSASPVVGGVTLDVLRMQQDEVAADRTRVEQAEERVAAKLATLAEERKKLKTAEDALKSQRKQLAAEQSKADKASERAKSLADTSSAEVDSLNSELIALRQELDAAKEAAAQSKSAERDFLEDKQRRVTAAQEELSTRAADLSSREGRLRATEEQLRTARGRLADADASHEETRRSLAEQQAQIEAVRADIDSQRELVAVEKEAAARQQNAVDDARAELKAREEAVSAKEAAAAAKAEVLAAKEAEVSERTRQLQEQRASAVSEPQADAAPPPPAFAEAAAALATSLSEALADAASQTAAMKAGLLEEVGASMSNVSDERRRMSEEQAGLSARIEEHDAKMAAAHHALEEQRAAVTREKESLSRQEEVAAIARRDVQSMAQRAEEQQNAAERLADEAKATMAQAESLMAEAQRTDATRQHSASAEMAETEARLAKEDQRLKEWAESLQRQDADMSVAAQRAQEVFKERADQLKLLQKSLDARARDVEATEQAVSQRKSDAEAAVAKAQQLERSAADQEARAVEVRREAREKLAAITVESHKLAQLRKDTGTPRTPVFAGPAVGRFMAASASVFRPLDAPSRPPARSPRVAGGSGDASPSRTPLPPAAASAPFDLADPSIDIFDAAASSEPFRSAPLLATAIAATESLRLHDITVPAQTWATFLSALEQHYNPNPFHNALRAADMVRSCVAFLRSAPVLEEALRPVEKFALVFAAAVADVGHPGVGSDYLNRTLDPVAVAANFRSSCEYGHLSLAFGLVQLPRLDVTTLLNEQDVRTFTELVSACVFATDPAAHHQLLLEAEDAFAKGIDLESAAHRHLLLRLLMRAADVMPAAQPDAVWHEWSARLLAERENETARCADVGMDVAQTAADDASAAAWTAQPAAFAAKIVAPVFGLLRRLWPEGSLDASLTLLLSHCDQSSVPAEETKAALSAQVDELQLQVDRLTDELAEAHAQISQGRAEMAQSSAQDFGSLQERHARVSAEVEAREEQLSRLDELEVQLAQSQDSMASLMRQLLASRAGATEEGTSDACSVDASAVVAQREQAAREQTAVATRMLAQAQAVRDDARQTADAALASQVEAATKMQAADEVLRREERVASLEKWVRAASANAASTAAREHAVNEAENRLAVAAERLDGVFSISRRRVEDLARLEATATAANKLLQEAAERERDLAATIEASRERRRRVAQARVLQQRQDPAPWLALEQQVYSLTDTLTAVSKQ